LGVSALAAAGVFTIAAMMMRQQILTLVFLALAYGAITFQQSVVFGVCLDIAHQHAGAVMGLMNTSAQIGGVHRCRGLRLYRGALPQLRRAFCAHGGVVVPRRPMLAQNRCIPGTKGGRANGSSSAIRLVAGPRWEVVLQLLALAGCQFKSNRLSLD